MLNKTLIRGEIANALSFKEMTFLFISHMTMSSKFMEHQFLYFLNLTKTKQISFKRQSQSSRKKIIKQVNTQYSGFCIYRYPSLIFNFNIIKSMSSADDK